MVMEHCAISQCGISKLSFSEAGYAVNHYNYIRFLRIAIIPFIRQHHGNGHYWLWIDLESAHYANNTLTVLWQQGTCFALKDANSPCVASLRPVEDFWPLLKKAIYNEGWEAQSQHWSGESRRRVGKFPFLQSFAYSMRSRSNWQFVLKMAIGQSTEGIEPRSIRH